MLGYEHLLISLGFTYLLHLIHPLPWEVFLGVAVGSLLPDVDAYSLSFLKRKSRRWALLYVPLALLKYLVWVPYAFVLSLLFRKDYFEHRSSSHSLLFLLFAFSAIYFLSKEVAWGILIGGVFHLLQDSLTVSGVAWFSPLHEGRLKGILKTGQKAFGVLVILSISAVVYAFEQGILPEEEFKVASLALFLAFLSPLLLRALLK